MIENLQSDQPEAKITNAENLSELLLKLEEWVANDRILKGWNLKNEFSEFGFVSVWGNLSEDERYILFSKMIKLGCIDYSICSLVVDLSSDYRYVLAVIMAESGLVNLVLSNSVSFFHLVDGEYTNRFQQFLFDRKIAFDMSIAKNFIFPKYFLYGMRAHLPKDGEDVTITEHRQELLSTSILDKMVEENKYSELLLNIAECDDESLKVILKLGDLYDIKKMASDLNWKKLVDMGIEAGLGDIVIVYVPDSFWKQLDSELLTEYVQKFIENGLMWRLISRELLKDTRKSYFYWMDYYLEMKKTIEDIRDEALWHGLSDDEFEILAQKGLFYDYEKSLRYFSRWCTGGTGSKNNILEKLFVDNFFSALNSTIINSLSWRRDPTCCSSLKESVFDYYEFDNYENLAETYLLSISNIIKVFDKTSLQELRLKLKKWLDSSEKWKNSNELYGRVIVFMKDFYDAYLVHDGILEVFNEGVPVRVLRENTELITSIELSR